MEGKEDDRACSPEPDDAAFWNVLLIVKGAGELSVGVYEFDIRPDCSYWLSPLRRPSILVM